MNITITHELLVEWGACVEVRERFCELFPDGAFLKIAAQRLKDDGHGEWGLWLYQKCRTDSRFGRLVTEGFDNSGNRNSGNRNSGDWNSGNSNSGNSNSGNSNSGNRNSGDSNSGNSNSGNSNSGNSNSGNSNSGNSNSGNRNSGDSNSGNWNSGDWNSGNSNSGYFNSRNADIVVFNKPCDRKRWDEADKPDFIYNVEVSYWVDDCDMTDNEKKDDPQFYVRGGQLRTRSYKEAWRLAWDNSHPEDRKKIFGLPNFDKEVFLEITGIDVDKSH